MSPWNSTSTEMGCGGSPRSTMQGITTSGVTPCPFGGWNCGSSQTVPFLVTFGASSPPLQGRHTAEVNKRQARCRQMSPLSSPKALEVARAHGRQLCQLLFVVRPVPAGVRLLPRLLSFWAWILSSCVYTNRTHHPQGVPPPDSVFPLLRLHTVIFDRQLEDTTHHDAWALGLFS